MRKRREKRAGDEEKEWSALTVMKTMCSEPRSEHKEGRRG